MVDPISIDPVTLCQTGIIRICQLVTLEDGSSVVDYTTVFPTLEECYEVARGERFLFNGRLYPAKTDADDIL